MQQIFPNVVATELMTSLSANENMLSSIAAAYFYVYAVLQIPAGMIIDRFNVKRPLILAITGSAIGALFFSVTNHPMNALIARLIMGAGAAFSFLGCLKLVQEWFPPSKFSTLAGMTNTAGMLGALCGSPIALAVNVVGWEKVMKMIGFAQLVLVVLVCIVLKDSIKPDLNVKTVDDISGNSEQKVGVFKMLRNKQVLLNAGFATGMSLIFVAFGGLWGSSYIMKYYEVDNVNAVNIGSILFIGAILGSLFFGWFSDKIRSRKKPMILAAFGGCVSLSVLLYTNHLSLPIFELALFLTGFFSSVNIVSYALARDIYPNFSGLSIGILSTIFYAGSATSQSLVGFLLEYHSVNQNVDNLDNLSVTDFKFALSSLVVFMMMSIVISFFIKESVLKENKANL